MVTDTQVHHCQVEDEVVRVSPSPSKAVCVRGGVPITISDALSEALVNDRAPSADVPLLAVTHSQDAKLTTLLECIPPPNQPTSPRHLWPSQLYLTTKIHSRHSPMRPTALIQGYVVSPWMNWEV